MAWLGKLGCGNHRFYLLSLDGVQGRSFVQPVRGSSFSLFCSCFFGLHHLYSSFSRGPRIPVPLVMQYAFKVPLP